MEKILSTRLDESVVHLLSLLSRQRKTSKKAIIEAAIRTYAESIDEKAGVPDPFESTLGAWSRSGESPKQTRERIRQEFKRSTERYRT